MTPRVLLYVQHLLGIGHLVRTGRLAAALAAAGFEVDIVMGGEAVPVFATSGMRVLQLPPVRAGPEGFSALLDQAGKPVDEAFWTERRARLLAAFDSVRPDILIIEAFPFGRRQMRPELLPLLAAAHGRPDRPLVVCSIRDILQESTKPDRAEETVAVLREFFDLVLVHGDPSFVRLDATFRLAHEIASLIRYTGMIGPPPAAPAQDRFDVVVSAGGGAVGLRLLRAALEARPATRLAEVRWCLVTGPNLDRAAAME
ncbi:MAG: glycosyl transferase, partial [Pseudomonadota bacterium]|nr:glycosyl transferase [Pseudomonadota bacterium]